MSNASTDPGTILERNELSESEQQALLATEPRREAVAVLIRQRGPIALEDLAHAVAERATTAGDAAAVEQAAERAAIDLHHAALPYLDDAGVVEYDPDENRVHPVAVDEHTRPTP